MLDFRLLDFRPLNQLDQGDQAKSEEGNIFKPGLAMAIALIVIAFLLWLVFGIFHTATNIKGAMAGIISIVVLLVVFFAFYATGDGQVSAKASSLGVTPTISNLISAAISTTGILVALALGAWGFSEIRNFFK